MANQKKGGQKDNPKRSAKVIPPIPDDKSKKNVENKKEAGDANKEDNCNSNCPQPDVVNTDKSKSWKRSEIISVVGIFISSCLFILAIRTFNNTQNQFRKSNEPFLQISNISLVNLAIDNFFGFKYRIANIGSYPVKIIKRGFVTFIDSVDATANIFNTLPDFTKDVAFAGQYLSNSNTDTALIYHDWPLGNLEMIQLIYGNSKIFFAGKIEYRNLITNKIDTYRFIIKYYVSSRYYDFIVNENIRGK